MNGAQLFYPPGSGGTGGADGGNIISAGTQLADSNATVVFSNSNNITFGLSNNSVLTASFAGGGGGAGLSAGTQSVNTGTVKFADSNGITFGMAGSSQITATVATNYQSQGAYLTTAMQSASSSVFAKTGFTSASTAGTDIVATHDTNGLSVGVPKYITTAQPVGAYLTTAAQSNQVINSINGSTGEFSFNTGSSLSSSRNANSVTFGLASNITTALQSAGAYLTTARGSTDAVGLNTAKTNVTWTVNSSGISLDLGAHLTTARASNDAIGLNTAFSNVTATVNSSGLSLDARGYAGTATGATNASITVNSGGVSVSVGAGGAGDGVNILAAGTQTANTTGTVLLSDGNGISFGMANSSKITASYTVPTVTNSSWTVSDSATSATVGRLAFTNLNGVTLSLSSSNNGNHTIVGSHNALTTARASTDAIGLNTAKTNVTWTVNSSGLSLDAGAYLTTAMASNAATISNIKVSGGASSLNLSALTFADSNGISFGLSNNSVMTATVKTDYQSSNANYLTSQSNQALSAANGSFAFQTASFSNVNGISFGTSAGSAITASHNAITTARASTDAIGLNTAKTNVTWTVNSSGISLDAGAYLTTARASNDAIGLNTAKTNVTWTVNSSGLSLNAGGYAGTGTSATNATFTLDTNGLALSVAAPGGGAAVTASASNGSFTAGLLGFSNANNVTFGTSAGSIVTASVAAPGAAAEQNAVNLLGANTAGNTTATGSTIGYSGVNLTLSGTNASQVVFSAPATSSLSATGAVSLSSNGATISIGAPQTSSLSATGGVSISTNGSTISIGAAPAVTYSRYNEFKESPMVVGQQGQATLHLQPWLIPNLVMDRAIIHIAFSNATNSSGSGTFSNWMGIYTSTGSTLSLLASTSITNAVTMSGTAGSWSQFGGFRQHSIGWTQTLTEGMYWIGIVNRTTTGGANMSYSQVLNSQINSNFSGAWGAASNATNALSNGFGVYTVSTAGIPSTIGFTQVNGSASLALRPPSLYFVSGSV